MSSSKRRRASRRNAMKSTGPRTEAGKAAVAQNARRHGLSGAFTILAHENKNEFESLLAEYLSEFDPQSAHESFLVEEMAHSRWTLARSRRIEAHLLDLLIGAELASGDPEARIAAALNAKSPNALATVQRYIAAADRAYYRAHRILTQARSAVLRNKAEAARAWFKSPIETAPPPVTGDLIAPDGTPDPCIFSLPPRHPLASAMAASMFAPDSGSPAEARDILAGSVPR